MNTDAHLRWSGYLEMLERQFRHGLYNGKSRSHRALRVVLVGLWIPEVDEQAIPKILSDVAVKATNDLAAQLLIRTNDLVELFWIKLFREGSRIDDIAEHHGQLPPFGGV